MDHRQYHLEPLLCVQGMGFIGRHDDHLTLLEQEGSLFNGYLGLAINDVRNCIVRCGMF